MTKSEYFKRHVIALYKNCYRGKLHFNVWEDLNQGLSNNDKLYSRYSFFWVTTLKAQLESAQLHLVKLFDTPKSSITIDRVVKYAEENKKDLFDTNKIEAVEIEINDYKSEIEEYRDQINSLLKIRHSHFVHLSKEYVDNYEHLYADYANIKEDIIDILLICGDILDTFLELAFEESKPMVLGTEYQTGELIADLSKIV